MINIQIMLFIFTLLYVTDAPGLYFLKLYCSLGTQCEDEGARGRGMKEWRPCNLGLSALDSPFAHV